MANRGAVGVVGSRTTSWASSAAVRRSMKANSATGTMPEVRLRSALHRAGLRFRKNIRPIAGLRCTADVVFARERIAVFVDGCFWHSCPDHATRPQTNRDWWAAKLSATEARDRGTRRTLEDAGWTVVRIWEHEAVAEAATSVRRAVVAARADLARQSSRP